MSLHRSLKTKPSALNQHRNVLNRAERIGKLTDTERFFTEKTSPLGLPKVANRLVTTAKKPKKEAVEGEAGVEGAAAVPGAPVAAGAPATAGAAKSVPAKTAPAKPAGGAKK
jgi:small basic protein (TIGR04137 family)